MKQKEWISYMLVLVFFFSVIALIPAKPVRAEKKSTYIPLLGEQTKKRRRKKIVVEEDKGTGEIPIMIGMGGGFFTALGTMNNDLMPGFLGGKVFLQYYRLPVQHFGAGMEVSTAYLQDRELSGGMLYLQSIPYLTLNFNPYNIIELQGRMGGGITWLRGDVETGTMTGTDFTFYTGLAVMKTFSKHYMIGAEAVVYYYFERKSSASVGLNLIFGYHL